MSKQERYLTRKSQYKLVYDQGGSWADGLLVLKALPNGLETSRCGFTISGHVGNAVVRNHTKRLLKELIRLTPVKPGWDMVFIARPPAAGKKFGELGESVTKLLSRADLLVGRYEEICPGID